MLAALALVATGCSPRSESAVSSTRSASEIPASRPNILLIVVDTLRADHLTSYGYGRATSPAIDALSARGVRFERHRAQAPCTFPSMNSLLTSRPVDEFFGKRDMSIPAGVPSVAELLRSGGYVTVAISASPIVRKNPSKFNPAGGFDRGFASFDDTCVWKDARCVNDHAHAALARHHTGEPVFLYLHYIDPHGPYHAPADGRRTFAGPGPQGADKAGVRAGISHRAAARIDRGEPAGVDAADVAHWLDLYDDEIAFVDARIGEFIREFERVRPSRGTIVALAADHGESFLEHGTLAHCRSLYDSEIRTPLILAGPGIPSRGVSDALSENLDIVPTLLDLSGLSVAPGVFTGRSLRAAIGGAGGPGTPAMSENLEPSRLQTSAFAGWRAAFDGRYKLMVHTAGGKLRLFDLARDPNESVDLAETERLKANELRRVLEAQSPTASKTLEAARETERQLRALGYL